MTPSFPVKVFKLDIVQYDYYQIILPVRAECRNCERIIQFIEPCSNYIELLNYIIQGMVAAVERNYVYNIYRVELSMKIEPQFSCL